MSMLRVVWKNECKKELNSNKQQEEILSENSIIINDASYGTEKAYNTFNMAMTLQKEHTEVKVLKFLLADEVGCTIPAKKSIQLL